MDGVLARMVLSSGIARLLWWRPRAVAACADGLVIERGGGRDETIAWAAIDAVIEASAVLVQSRGRVVARLDPDDDGADALIDVIVGRAGLEWIERGGRRRGPRMAVHPDVAARLRT